MWQLCLLDISLECNNIYLSYNVRITNIHNISKYVHTLVNLGILLAENYLMRIF